MLEIINPIKIAVLLTFLNAFCLRKKNKCDIILVKILFISLIIEFTNSILILFDIPFGRFMSLGIIMYYYYWLIILKKSIRNAYYTDFLTLMFVLFGIINFIFLESTNFNYYTFVLGTIIYISIFIIESFHQLKKENLLFFQSNNYNLLFAPILLFLGMSFMFGFKSKILTSFIIIYNVKLYTLVIYFVNIIYYLLLNLYIYKERKLKNV
jgi:hypothetical protein